MVKNIRRVWLPNKYTILWFLEFENKDQKFISEILNSERKENCGKKDKVLVVVYQWDQMVVYIIKIKRKDIESSTIKINEVNYFNKIL